jgi:hypothetical protein
MALGKTVDPSSTDALATKGKNPLPASFPAPPRKEGLFLARHRDDLAAGWLIDFSECL